MGGYLMSVKKILSAIAAVLIITASVPAFAAGDIMLTVPDKEGGPSVLAAISERASGKIFARRDLSLKDLSTILWAAAGKNREEKGWTVPFAMGQEPYVNVYVLTSEGCYLYDWNKNMLKLLSDRKLLKKAGTQEYVGTAPVILVFGTKGSGPRIESWADVAVGAMSQNVYLAAEALGMKTRYVASFNKMTLIDALNIGPLSRIIAIMPIGY